MPTSLTHAFVGGTLSLYEDTGVSRPKLAVTLMVLAVLPDIDALSVPLGLGHDHLFAHRGLTHSLPFAAAIGLLALATLFRRVPRFTRNWWALWGLLSLSVASHGLLDALTYLAGGIALWAPFDTVRYVSVWRHLPPAPFAVGRLQSYFAPGIMLAEVSRVWLPVGAAAMVLWGVRRLRSRPRGSAGVLPGSEAPDQNEAVRNTPGAPPSPGVPWGVLLGCLATVALCAFLEPTTTHEVSAHSITYRGISPEGTAAIVREVGSSIERRHEEALHVALRQWRLAFDEDPPFRHRLLHNADGRWATGSGSATGDLPVPLEYRFRVREVAPRPGEDGSAGIAFDVEVEFQVQDRHATAGRRMQELIRDGLALLFCHELDRAAKRRDMVLTLKDWSDPALATLPTPLGAR